MFEQTFKNIDNILWKDPGCSTELHYVEQTSWILFLKYLDDLEKDRQDIAELTGKTYKPIIDFAREGRGRARTEQGASRSTRQTPPRGRNGRGGPGEVQSSSSPAGRGDGVHRGGRGGGRFAIEGAVS